MASPKDIPRHVVEIALGLFHQGQGVTAIKMLQDALEGRFPEPPAIDEDQPLELDLDPEAPPAPPEIPPVRVEHGEVLLDDDGWDLDSRTVREIKDAGRAALDDGFGREGAEAVIRGVLIEAVETGRVRRR